MDEGGVDPKSLDNVIRNVWFARRRTCSARVVRRHTIVTTGESWIGPEACGEFALYATVRKGRVSPRCREHAEADSKAMCVAIDENTAIERRVRVR